jgi:hypothetical protein
MQYSAVRYVSGLDPRSTPQAFNPRFYNHAYRLRLKKVLCLERSRSPSGYFKSLLDPGGRFRSETAVTWPFQK